VAITDESIGISRLLGDARPGCLSKVYAYDYYDTVSPCLPFRSVLQFNLLYVWPDNGFVL